MDWIRVFASSWIAGKSFLGEDWISTQVSCLHDSAQGFSEIGRNGMAVVQSFLGHDEFAVWLKDNEVGVVASDEAALARVAAGKASWGRGHPLRQILQRESALAGLSPH